MIFSRYQNYYNFFRRKENIVLLFFIIVSVFYGSYEIYLSANKDIQDRLNQLFMLFLKSAISFVIAFACILKLKISKIIKIPLIMILIGEMIFLFQSDKGSSNKNISRAYTKWIFLFVFLLMVFGLVVVHFCIKFRVFHILAIHSKKIIKYSLVIILLIFLFSWLYIKNAQKNWKLGLFGEEFDPNTGDGYPPLNAIPWFSLFPSRFFNFFMGSNDCPKMKQFSKIENNVLEFFDCSSDKDPVVDLDPDLISEKKPSFIYGNCLNKFHLDPKHISYTHPINVSNQTNIRAFCGKDENYFIKFAYDHFLHKSALDYSENFGKPKVNVDIFLIDGISRQHFMRRLKKSVIALENLANNGYSVFQFWRYSCIGFNTFPNLTPMMLGVEPFNRFTTKQKTIPKPQDVNPFWDYYPDGYIKTWCMAACDNFFDVNWPIIGGCPFDQHFAKEFCHPDYEPGFWTNFIGPMSIRRRCMAGKYVHKYAFDIAEQFREVYPDVGRLLYVHLMEAHETSSEVVSLIDPDLSNYIENFEKNSKDTILFILADHGNGMSPLSYTISGFVESRNPVFFLVIPNKILDENPEVKQNLIENQQRIISAYDIYLTLKHIPIGISSYLERDPRDPKKAMSLFEKIPKRSCEEADISPEYCVFPKDGKVKVSEI
ncbi:hypothetical protein M0811_04379 [Anaeramoeba ignava]|uniref:Uncharacterized protein n=1 Tax=Anaeramoeba ignava TaxID=1746090 RepID=A0A9Q0LXQ7_ANAIG|nr:hypothetical protein M0811_04379 [Anaeramoeba ignava]